ncbi:MAG: Fe-S cluster assembly protein SufD [Actinobacteria bacterium]|nr:Fe-S cluster assembly protein SufD [Actinomycetota bacterium]
MPADAHTPDVARALAGPTWLTGERVAAAERYATADLPTSALEEWRYSRIDKFDLGRYAPVPAPQAPVASSAAEPLDLGAFSARIVVQNGFVAAIETTEALDAAGVIVARAADLAERPAMTVASHSGGGDTFSELNEAFAPDPVVIIVPRNTDLAAPIVIAHHVDAEAGLVLPRIVVDAGENSSVSIVEWLSSAAVDALVIPRTSLHLAGAARVNHSSVNNLAESVNQFGAIVASAGQEATVTMEHVALGGDFARNRFDCRLVGRGSTGRISALYLGDRHQMHDLRTFQNHEARDTSSDLLFKGAVDGSSHAVYTGLIHVGEGAAGTNANQTNRVITLSDAASAESVPNLEIHHNDVRCSHATAVGPIDEEQRFYLESRGVPPEHAERLVVNGFFADVLEAIGNDRVVELVRPLIAAKLEAQS